MLAATAQQGAGIIDCHVALTSASTVEPGQISLRDDPSHTSWGAGNLTLTNGATVPRTYTLGHRGAGYVNQYGGSGQQPAYGSAVFSAQTVTLQPGQSTQVAYTVTPPVISTAQQANLPVMGGFITVDSAGSGPTDTERFSVPYVGPAYSLYHASYIHIVNETGNVQPQIRFFYPNSSSTPVLPDRATGIIVVNASVGFASTMTHDQWTMSYRIDLVPANTSFVPDHYGFDRDVARSITYVPSRAHVTGSLFNGTVPSYGTLVHQENGLAICSCTNLSPSGKTGGGTTVTVLSSGSDGARAPSTYLPGPGDYRWLLSIRRWGGVDGVREHHETWMGPVLRFVDGPV